MIRLPLAVPAAGPLYDGHFPGRPILPGVGLLDLAVRALATAGSTGQPGPPGPPTGLPPALREIALLRLRRPVLPGEVLVIEAQPQGAGAAIPFEIRRGSERVANGLVTLGDPPGAVAAPGTAPGDPPPAPGLPDLDDLVPHRPPMRFIRRVEAAREDGVVCTALVPERGPFAEHGAAPALVALEMAAQAAAVREALCRRRAGDAAGPHPGYLVGARDVRFGAARLRCGEAQRVAVRLAADAPPLTTYAFEVRGVSGQVATGSISIWVGPTGA